MNDYIDTYDLLKRAGDKSFIKLSEWTIGELGFTKRLPTPSFCHVYFSSSLDVPDEIREYFNMNKRVKGVVAFTGTQIQREQILQHFKKPQADK